MSAVWSWDDVPWDDPPRPRTPPPARVVRPYRRWALLWLAEGEHCAAPAGRTPRQVQSVASTAAHRHGLRFVIHATEAGVFVRRVPPGTTGIGTEVVRASVPAESRTVSFAVTRP